MKKLIFSLLLTSVIFSCAKSTAPDPAPAPVVDGTTTFTVTDPMGTMSYNINGTENPTLILKRGSTYAFNLSVAGHPFYINSASGTGTGNAYNTGVTTNGMISGTVTFIVPANAPSTLYYNCSLHSMMAGVMNITN